MLKIYIVQFNDGGWYSTGGRPNFTVVSESKDEAIKQVLEKNPEYKIGWDSWASEFKIDGYIIEIYEEKTYIRNKNIETLGV